MRKSINIKVIDWIILGLIGIVSFLYSITRPTFAEIHINVPFLTFPLFVGEILLLVCLVLVGFKWAFSPQKRYSKKMLIFLFFYFLFVSVKLISGYYQYGPLACRHAAMFIYPIFAIVTYSSARSVFSFSEWIKISVFIFSFLACFFIELAFYKYSYIVLGFMAAGSLKNRRVRIIALILMLIVAPFKEFFFGARTIILATMVAVIFFMGSLGYIVFAKNRWRNFIMVIAVIVGIGLFYFFTPAKLKKVIFSFKNILEVIRVNEDFIESRRSKYKPRALDVKVYNPYTFSDSLKNDPEEGLSEQNDSTVQAYIDMIKIRESNPFFSFRDYRKSVEDLELVEQQRIAKIKEEKLKFKERTLQRAMRQMQDKLTEESDEELLILMKDLKNLKNSLGQNFSDDEQWESLAYKLKRENIQFTELTESSISGIYKGGTITFRYNIFRDMLEELIREKAILGLPFGKPFRSQRLEITANAWGEWTRDGWIASHNSFLEGIYRAGIVAFVLFLCLFIRIGNITRNFLNKESFKGIFLVSIIVSWLISAFFMIILEMPYFAIPFWSFFGFVCFYEDKLKSSAELYEKK